MIQKSWVYWLAVVSFASFMNFACFAQTQPALTHHVPQAVQNGSAKFIGHLPGNQKLRLVLTLPLRNQTELKTFIQELSDPSSPSYHHYLTVQQFTAKFGPSQDDYNSLIKFAKTNGLHVVSTSLNRLNLSVEAPVSKIESVFHLHLNTYRHPAENRTFYAPDREPTVNLAIRLWHISGLDNYSIPQPALLKKSAEQSGNVPNATTGSGPSASFLGSDMRAAYYGGTALTGSGQSVGLLEYRGADLADLDTYFQSIGQTNNVSVLLDSTDGTSTSCLYANGCDDTEPILDITQAIGMAPGLSNVVLFVGSSDVSILNAMATTTPLISQLSISWAWTPDDPSTDDPYFMEFAAQGQSVFAAAGDTGAWSSSTQYVFPADDPYVTSVGGTDLETSSAAGPWSSETAWADGGGGISPDFLQIPDWQTATALGCPLCSTAYRNGPDVAANANWSFYVCSNQTTCTANYWGGTSFAAPMWAGYMALANQQAAAQGIGPVGFVNPALYTLAAGSGYSADFHDITSGSNGNAAATGYDLATGLGSPNGSALIDALTQAPSFSLFSGSTSVTVGPGDNGSTSVTTTAFAGFDSAIDLSASGQPTGVTVTFSSTTFAAPGSGSANMTVAVDTTVAPGTYPITVTATGGSITRSVTVSLVVPSPSFSVSASPASVSAAQGNSGTSIITTAALYGFNAAITLSASGEPTGMTIGFAPMSIGAPGNGTSQLTVNVASTVATGTYPVTVTGVGGGITQTTIVNVAVVPPPDFSISTNYTRGQISEGSSGTFTVYSNYSNGFNSAIALSASGLPTGDSISFSPASIPAPGYGSSTATVVIGTNTTPGIYPISITGTGGGITHTVTYTLTVPKPDFTLNATLASPNVYQGKSDGFSVQIVGSNGFDSAVDLSTSGEPAGVTVSYNPASFPAPGNGEGSIDLSVAFTAVPGTYPITVTAVGGGVTHSVTANLTVVEPPGLSIATSLASLTIDQGGSNTATVTTSVSGSFDSTVTFEASGYAPGISWSFSPASIAAPGNGSTTLTIAIASTMAPGNYHITVIASGQGLNASSQIALTVVPPSAFNSVNVGTSTSAVPFVFTFASAATLGSTSILTEGNSNGDFADAGSDTCTTNTAYSAGQTCTVNVIFTPKFPGTRVGAVVLKDNNGNVINTAYLQGTGVGPQVRFLPGAQTAIPTAALSGLAGAAVDGSGNIYLVDADGNRVLKETPAGGSYVESTVASDLSHPGGVAVDGAGDVFIADTQNARVLEEIPTSGGYSESTVVYSYSGLGNPLQVAVDGSGNVIVAFSTFIDKFLSVDGYTQYAFRGNGFNNPSGLAVDGSGDIFVADTGNNAVKEILASGSTITLLSGLSSPTGLTLDGGGNLYVSDNGNNRVIELLKASGYTTVNTMPGNFSGPDGLAVSGSGNLYVSNSGSNLVTFEDFADPPSLTFASTPVGSTSADSPQTVTLENIGSADLTFPIPATGNNPSITSNFTLGSNGSNLCPIVDSNSSAPGTLAAGASCALDIGFAPATAGNLSGALVLTDNNLNAAVPGYASQSIALSGMATQATPTITWGQPAAITYGTALSTTQLDATASVPGTFSYSPAAGTVLSAGTHTLSVTFTPTDTTDYTTATANVSLTVNQATPVLTWPTPTSIDYGTALSAVQLDATASVPGTFNYLPAAGTVLRAGTQTLLVTFTPADTTDYTTATANVQLTVNQVTPVITWPTPVPIDYGTALSSTQLDATANTPGTFVYSPAAGTIPAVGTDTLTVTFTPSDTVDYSTAAASVALVVNPKPDFSLAALPSSMSIKQGSRASTTISVTPIGGFNGRVSLAVSGLPKWVTATLSPDPTATTSMLTLTVKNHAATGTTTLTITGTSGSLVHTTTFTLTVVPR